MTGLLRYALLKGLRDGSLITLIVAPAVMAVLPMVVVVLFERSSSHSNARIPPEVAQMLPVLMSALMSSLAAFMVFRTEIANHAIGSFVLATRSWLVPLAASIYGCAVGFLSATITVIGFGLTLRVWPLDILRMVIQVFAVTWTASAFAALAVTLTNSLAASAWIYAAVLFAMVSTDFLNVSSTILLPVSALGTLLTTLMATLFLERRCAS